MTKTASLFPWHLTLKCFLSCLPERILAGDDLLPVVTVITGICNFFFSPPTKLWTKMPVLIGKQIECQLAPNLSRLPRKWSRCFPLRGSDVWLKSKRKTFQKKRILGEVSYMKMWYLNSFSSRLLAKRSRVIPSHLADLKWCINCFAGVDDTVWQDPKFILMTRQLFDLPAFCQSNNSERWNTITWNV